MKIRRYIGSDTQEALLKVKMDLGNDAVILNTRKVRRKGFWNIFSKPMVEVLAAIDEDYSSKKEARQPDKGSRGEAEGYEKDRQPAGEENYKKVAELENKISNMESSLQKVLEHLRAQPGHRDGSSSTGVAGLGNGHGGHGDGSLSTGVAGGHGDGFLSTGAAGLGHRHRDGSLSTEAIGLGHRVDSQFGGGTGTTGAALAENSDVSSSGGFKDDGQFSGIAGSGNRFAGTTGATGSGNQFAAAAGSTGSGNQFAGAARAAGSANNNGSPLGLFRDGSQSARTAASADGAAARADRTAARAAGTTARAEGVTASADGAAAWAAVSADTLRENAGFTAIPDNAWEAPGSSSQRDTEPEKHNACSSLLKLFAGNLIKNEVEADITQKIIASVNERIGTSININDAASMLYNAISGILGKPETIKQREDGRTTVVIFVGPTGVGKTTTIAKLATNLALNQKKSVGFITADTYRIAAVEQLKTYADILGMPVSVIYTPEEVKEAIKNNEDKDFILIDTAGRSHKNKVQFDELQALVKACGADETYLVLSSTTSCRNCREILANYSFLMDYRIIFTKLDETPINGIILNSRYMTGKSLSYVTTGQNVPDDIEIANIDKITRTLLGSVT